MLVMAFPCRHIVVGHDLALATGASRRSFLAIVAVVSRAASVRDASYSGNVEASTIHRGRAVPRSPRNSSTQWLRRTGRR